MRKYSFLAVISLLISACAAQPTPIVGNEETQVRTLVENFGAVLQEVSLLAPDAAAQIEEHYAPFVSPDLLVAWMADSGSAPGRLSSSPWPDRIEVSSVDLQADGSYLVSASVIEVTSTEVGTDQAAAQYPVEITVSLVDGMWLITSWMAGDYQ